MKVLTLTVADGSTATFRHMACSILFRWKLFTFPASHSGVSGPSYHHHLPSSPPPIITTSHHHTSKVIFWLVCHTSIRTSVHTIVWQLVWSCRTEQILSGIPSMKSFTRTSVTLTSYIRRRHSYRRHIFADVILIDVIYSPTSFLSTSYSPTSRSLTLKWTRADGYISYDKVVVWLPDLCSSSSPWGLDRSRIHHLISFRRHEWKAVCHAQCHALCHALVVTFHKRNTECRRPSSKPTRWSRVGPSWVSNSQNLKPNGIEKRWHPPYIGPTPYGPKFVRV